MEGEGLTDFNADPVVVGKAYCRHHLSYNLNPLALTVVGAPQMMLQQYLPPLARSFLIDSSSKLLVTRTSIKARSNSILGRIFGVTCP